MLSGREVGLTADDLASATRPAQQQRVCGLAALPPNKRRELEMEYRQLGRSGLRISALTLGTMTFGGKGWAQVLGSTDVAGAKQQIGMALDAGVNLIDTADVYSEGRSEEIVAAALADRRDEVLLATKVRMPMGSGPNDAGLSRNHI